MTNHAVFSYASILVSAAKEKARYQEQIRLYHLVKKGKGRTEDDVENPREDETGMTSTKSLSLKKRRNPWITDQDAINSNAEKLRITRSHLGNGCYSGSVMVSDAMYGLSFDLDSREGGNKREFSTPTFSSSTKAKGYQRVNEIKPKRRKYTTELHRTSSYSEDINPLPLSNDTTKSPVAAAHEYVSVYDMAEFMKPLFGGGQDSVTTIPTSNLVHDRRKQNFEHVTTENCPITRSPQSVINSQMQSYQPQYLSAENGPAPDHIMYTPRHSAKSTMSYSCAHSSSPKSSNTRTLSHLKNGIHKREIMGEPKASG